MYLDENGLTTFWGKIKDWSTEKLKDKADAADVYTKDQVDNKINGIDALEGRQYYSSSTDIDGTKYEYRHIDFGTGSTKFSLLFGWADFTYVRNLCVYFPLMSWKNSTFNGCLCSLGKPPNASTWRGGDYWPGEVSFFGKHPSWPDDCVMIPINTETTNANGIGTDKIRVSILCWGLT